MTIIIILYCSLQWKCELVSLILYLNFHLEKKDYFDYHIKYMETLWRALICEKILQGIISMGTFLL